MTRRIDDPLVIDADAHILEPPDLWQRYIDPAFRDRPICIKTDQRGLEYLEIDGKMSKRNSGGMLFTVGGYGKSLQELMPRPDRTYADTAPLGAMDPRERLTYMDQEGVDASVLYPSLALLWEPEVFDAALCDAYCRAYNRWIVDFCADSADRLIPIAHISLGDVERARQTTGELQGLAATSTSRFRFHDGKDIIGAMAHILEGEIFWTEDNREAALGAFREAVTYYNNLNYDEPEPLPFSPRHWLGALHLEMEAYDNALAEYRQDLSEHPNNIWALWGIQQALAAQGESDPEIDEKLEGAFEYADIWLPTTKF